MTTKKVKLSTWTKATAATAIILIGGVWAVAVFLFGSTSAALAFLDGERLLLDSQSKSFGTVDPGTEQIITYTLMNRTGHSVTLIGSRTSCGCTVAADLPLTIPDSSAHKVRISVNTTRLAGKFSASVRLFADDPKHSEIELKVQGWIRTPPTSTAAQLQ
jgi:hypothetical protein